MGLDRITTNPKKKSLTHVPKESTDAYRILADAASLPI